MDKHHWAIQGSIATPSEKWPHHRQNRELHVLCDTARRALELAEQQIPGLVIHSVQRSAKIDFIDDYALTPSTGEP